MHGLFVWRDEYALGLDEVDAQHKRLFHLGGEAVALAPAGLDNDAAARLIADIAAAVQNHFRTEEALMIAHGCPSYAAHKSEHDALLAMLPGLAQRGITAELLMQLDGWIRQHIAGADLIMATELTRG